MEDHDLIRKFQQGDEGAFNQLVIRHQDWVKDFILRSIRHKEDAEDIAQDIFVRMYFGLQNFRFEAEFTTWAYRVIINQLNNYYRKKKVLSWFSSELNEEVHHGFEDPEESRKSELITWVRKLPRVQRNVMILRSFQDMTFKQVASTLGITENSAKVSYFKAKNNLKKISNDRN
ncbi:MAG: sigma-70 family RNA polymerase sigma factor [Bacteroidetes bacterium]|nr:sigma-70 family RNA polymerase sigma factor [Bacteroidota bacterium]